MGTAIMDDAQLIYNKRCEVKLTGAYIGSEYTGPGTFNVCYQATSLYIKEMYISRLNVKTACAAQNIYLEKANYPAIANKTFDVPPEGGTIQVGPYNTGS